ncbi:MAG: SOS response-associated peptidase [Myxococcota bacterium]|nr:SOS response-associated peptidase [Myxococcota bacterium]
MCGRYQLSVPIDELIDLFSTPASMDFSPRYNIAPSQTVPVIRGWSSTRSIDPIQWGLVPPWADSPKSNAPMINARSETVTEKPTFRSSFQRQRCLIPASGFYEWEKTDTEKIPHLIKVLSQDVYAMAGIWCRWVRGKNHLETFSILTTTANARIHHIHERMPVILHPDDYSTWLDPRSPQETLLNLCRPVPNQFIDVMAVSDRVNSARNDDSTCEDGRTEQQSLF